MTEDQRRMALALNACTFNPGIAPKRFAQHMAFLAEHGRERPLTDKQDAYLRWAVKRFRRQIPPDVVALANCSGIPADGSPPVSAP